MRQVDDVELLFDLDPRMQCVRLLLHCCVQDNGPPSPRAKPAPRYSVTTATSKDIAPAAGWCAACFELLLL